MSENKKPFDPTDSNPDLITGESGSHPVGTGIGAAGVGTAATAIGAALGGPVGAVVGAAVGAIAGGLAGKGIAEKINPTVEDEYWRNNYSSRSYVEKDYTYDDYSPAYRTGYQGYSTYAGQGLTYDQAEPHLRSDYERQYGNSRLGWEKARHASRDAWDRIERAIPGDIDHDGK